MLLHSQRSSSSRWFSPWIIAVVAAFVLGLYLGAVNNFRKGALGSFGGTAVVRTRSDRAAAAAYNGGAVAGSKKRSRYEDGDEEDIDDPSFEAEDEEDTDSSDSPRTRKSRSKKSKSSKSSKKTSKKSGSKKSSKKVQEEEQQEEEGAGSDGESGGDEGKPSAPGKMGVVEAPPKPDTGAVHSVRFHDGQTIQVYPHIDHGAGGRNWWPSVDAGWEGDTLQAMRFFLTKAREQGKKPIQIDFGAF
jgi:hypothetical protein